MVVVKAPGTWTYEDLFALPDDRRFEIIDGRLFEMPAPEEDHARAVLNLIALLLLEVRSIGARMYTAPFDVFFTGANPVQPDIFIVLSERLHLIKRRGVEGAPDLVVEVVSPSRSAHDRRIKRPLYARASVKEYWLVNPKTRSIEVLALDGAVYRTHYLAIGEEVVSSLILPGISFPAPAAFA